MTKSTLIVNFIGLFCGLLGTIMMFIANPTIETFGYLADEDALKKSRTKTKLFRIGMAFLSLGFLFQIIGLFLKY
jgi:hypothetical protein